MKELVDRLAEEDWRTELFQDFESALDQGGDPLQDFCERTSIQFENAWERYTRQQILESEVTVESAVGHQLLRGGIDHWFRALDRACQGRSEEALDYAEQANRMLVALQHLQRRVEQSA